jgi:hypothetical protein
MTRIRVSAIVLVFGGLLALAGADAHAQTPAAGAQIEQASPASAEQQNRSQRAARPAVRLRVYPSYRPEPDGVSPRYFPGPNAVRSCSVKYLQEFRPSGTVITPHMSCAWRQG